MNRDRVGEPIQKVVKRDAWIDVPARRVEEDVKILNIYRTSVLELIAVLIRDLANCLGQGIDGLGSDCLAKMDVDSHEIVGLLRKDYNLKQNSAYSNLPFLGTTSNFTLTTHPHPYRPEKSFG